MDSYVFKILDKEQERQDNAIELIASENFVSKNVLKALGSVFTNKYTEGYPAERSDGLGASGRYYGGCENYDELEEYCCSKWKQVFNTDYHVNVQPHSGSQANMAAYMSVLNLGDTILSMSLDAGGHLTHGSSVSFVSKLYNVISYGVTNDGILNYEDIENKMREFKPKLIVVGASAYSRIIDFKRIYDIIQKVKSENCQIDCIDAQGNRVLTFGEDYSPYFMVDMAHIAGLVAAGEHPSPFGLADIITTTTHKTLRGPRGGLIFCKPELAKKIDLAVFPRCQGGSLQNVIAAKAVCAEEALTPEFKVYIQDVVNNCHKMAEKFKELGYKIVSNGTDNHLFLLDLSDTGISGAELQEECDKNGITLNKNAIPNDPRPPKEASGVRIGTAAMTTKGWGPINFQITAKMIDFIIKDLQLKKGLT